MPIGETVRKLAAITDEGEFERLATAVLRDADSRYRRLIHAGVNVAGKTVKAPVDGITFVTGANPPHMIAVQHTICARNDLERKWLHDPATVRPRKSGKAAAPEGDLVKTIKIFDEQKTKMPTLQATLILTTNQEPSENLVREVNAAADAAGLTLELWPRSAIAHFLDFDPKGQWLRRSFLHIEQERLSEELLRELSRRSLDYYSPPGDKSLWIDRPFDRTLRQLVGRHVLLVVAESGRGKSVACYKQLMSHVERGGYGLVIPNDVVAEALSLDQAIDAALRQLHPSLVPGSGSDARVLASENPPLLMVLEDINKSGRPGPLIERLAAWNAQSKDDRETPSWQILCPVWPRMLNALGEESRKHIDELITKAPCFSIEEGAAAVQRRRQRSGIPVMRLQAEAVSLALGHDPLLIALHDPTAPPSPERVIGQFIESSLGRMVASRQEFTAAEYWQALRALAAAILERRCLDLTMSEAATWFSIRPEIARMLRHIAHFGEVLHVIGPASEERLAFRHDRVRDWLLADAAADLMRRDSTAAPLISEPYFAEVIGAALLRDTVPVENVDRIRASNPLALFCALGLLGEPATEIHRAVLAAAQGLLDEEAAHGSQHDHLRWEIRRVLSEVESAYVIPLVGRFRERGDWWALRARFRNGDISAGIELCLQHKPGVGIVGHLELIEHVQQRLGVQLIHTLGGLLCGNELTPGARIGALRLAGHLADPALADAIETSWHADSAQQGRLAEYLWAGARCCGEDAARLLGPICDVWASLPEEPRRHLAFDQIRWAFRKGLPQPALRYFIERAKKPELRWPITYMIDGLDHPDAVEFVASELAARMESSGGQAILLTTLRNEWSRQQQETGRPMSATSRGRLEELWKSPSHGRFLREQAFKLWSSTVADGDITLLRSVSETDELADIVLWARLRRADHSAIPRLMTKLQQGDWSWWRTGRFIWSDELTDELDDELKRRGTNVQRGWDVKNWSDSDHITYELLMGLAAQTAEKLLLKHWDHLRYSPYFVQAALYVATPRLREAAAATISECPNPKALLEHVSMHYGYKTNGRAGATHMAQVESLLPYLDYVTDVEISLLWEMCNDHGWFELRRQHLDPRLTFGWGMTYIDDNQTLMHLDAMLSQGPPYWPDLWVDGFLEAGGSIDRLMSLVQTWLGQRRQIPALELAAAIVIQVGKRSHISILSAYDITPIETARLIIANASYAVRRRSLN